MTPAKPEMNYQTYHLQLQTPDYAARIVIAHSDSPPAEGTGVESHAFLQIAGPKYGLQINPDGYQRFYVRLNDKWEPAGPDNIPPDQAAALQQQFTELKGEKSNWLRLLTTE